jgi:hypothetical protein
MKQFKSHTFNLWVALLSLTSLLFACNQKPKPTYALDIAPIVFKNCITCHHPKGAGPFSLMRFHDVKKRAKMIAFVTSTSYMPPWPADKNYSHFINERSLTENEIQLIQNWYRSGAEAGDTSNLRYPEMKSQSSILGVPDMIIDIPSVQIKNNNTDQFYTIKIPYEIPQNKYVKAVDFIPGQLKYVHHFNGHYLAFTKQTNPFDGIKILNLQDSLYAQSFELLKLKNHDGTLPFRVHSAVNYLPGSFGVQYPNGIGGFELTQKGAFIANDIHYGPSRQTVYDSSKLYLYFSDVPPKRQTFELMMGTNGVSKIEPPLLVPAGKITKHTTQLSIYNDISILTINPHMHLIGSKFKAYAIKPNGDTIPLIHIPQWQFRWQYFYTFQNPVKIPKGSSIIVEAEFNNSSKNPDNPNKPPQDIGERLDYGGASMRTTDEMLQFIITYMPYQKGDEQIDLGGR